MTHDKRPIQPIFRINVSADQDSNHLVESGDPVVDLLRQMVNGQQRQNQLLEDLTQMLSAQQRQRSNELVQWKQANPELARGCRMAAEALSQVQTEFLEKLTEEVNENAECLMEGEFMLNEFVDRFGPRLAHLNGVLQVLSQLSSVPNPTNATQQ